MSVTAVSNAEPVPFPPDFVWGVATAAYQIEGAVGADGRGPSIWDTFCAQQGTVRNGDTGDIACDHYHRLDEDLDLLAELGVGSYRLSVAWPRVQPSGKGPVNQPGLDFYRRLVGGLRDRGIQPTVTLYHWDLPQPLEDAGGWTSRDTAGRFAEYAAIVGEALGDAVARWITLNEPWCAAWQGYGNGHHAPGRAEIGAACAATHHLLLGHGQACERLRAVVPGAPVGITLNLAPVTAATDHPDDLAAARRHDGNLNRLFTDPVLRGVYPGDMLEHYRAARPGFAVIADGDLEIIATPTDFLGVNFYAPHTLVAAGREGAAFAARYCVPRRRRDVVAEDLGAVTVHRPAQERTAMDWEVDPTGLSRLLAWLHSEYGPRAIYITENGAAYADYVDHSGQVHDGERVRYLDGHLRALHDALAGGVDVRGYFVWSLLDNFEWAYGYDKRFGLVWVDYPSGTRIPKDSFAWYRQVCRTGRVPARP